jgi:hypothetical protein
VSAPETTYPYEWALLRVVPRVERGEFVNAGVLVYCHRADVLVARVALDEGRLLALDSRVDLAAVREHLEAVRLLAAGGETTGASGARTPGDRFRWLVAPRSTVVQAGPVHTGISTDPEGEADRLLARLVTTTEQT